ncbi:hypothetical protein GG681_12025 [Epibacterium sp. SM1969]|uniref:Histidinol phosphate aminotransferase n=1 Tax=Tritonibacter aquimaris TaxID=2663379 RepID=A0A844AZF5_9RHOB|nr:hypothetical protein [Tritonibacter aquimaris]MQY43372.1 hypothetical protein [Tritonibacter aquimaris]
MQQREDQSDYLSAFCIFASVILFWVLMILWAAFGMVAVVAAAVLINHLIGRMQVVLDEAAPSQKQH